MPVQSRIEIMAPAGSFESLAAALQAGRTPLYFGVGKLNQRFPRHGQLFRGRPARKFVARCHEAGS